MKKTILYAGIMIIVIAISCPSIIMADDGTTTTTTETSTTGSAGNLVGLSLILPMSVAQDITTENPSINGSDINNLEGGGDNGDGNPIPPPDDTGDDIGWDTHNG